MQIRNSGEGKLVEGRDIGAPILLNKTWFGLGEGYYSYPNGLEYHGVGGAGFSINSGEGIGSFFGGIDLSGAEAMIVNIAKGNSFNPSAYALRIGGSEGWGQRPQYFTNPIYVTFMGSGSTYKYQVNEYGGSTCVRYGSSSSC